MRQFNTHFIKNMPVRSCLSFLTRTDTSWASIKSLVRQTVVSLSGRGASKRPLFPCYFKHRIRIISNNLMIVAKSISKLNASFIIIILMNKNVKSGRPGNNIPGSMFSVPLTTGLFSNKAGWERCIKSVSPRVLALIPSGASIANLIPRSVIHKYRLAV